MSNHRKLVVFDASERDALEWMVEHGFGRNQSDAVRKSVVLARRVVEEAIA